MKKIVNRIEAKLYRKYFGKSAHPLHLIKIVFEMSILGIILGALIIYFLPA